MITQHRYLIALFCSFLLIPKLFCQNSDTVIGFWLTTDENTNEPKSQIHIYKESNGTYSGKIVWLQKPLKNNLPLHDEHNTNEELRSKLIIGLTILEGFQFTDEQWEDGTIYDPQSGKTYRCKMWFENDNVKTLYVRGFIGIALLGRSTQWSREERKR